MKSLHELHQSGTFVLVNVYDAGSAALAAAAGAEALGTTSGGHAYTIGRPDAAGAITSDEAVARVAEICSTVDVPVSVDAENGWGHDPGDVAQTIERLIEVGAAGASIEDWSGDSGIGFYEQAHAVDRIVAAVETARGLDPEFVICARADRMTHDGADAFDDALARLQAFAGAGAHCLYAPGTADMALIERIVREAGGPVNALLSVGGTLSIDDMREIGVRRVSLGSSLYQATMAVFDRIVRQALTTGALDVDTPPLDWKTIESLFPNRPATS
jgi:2-methylisocitrate lyase-like PEP mutase family enzyme